MADRLAPLSDADRVALDRLVAVAPPLTQSALARLSNLLAPMAARR